MILGEQLLQMTHWFTILSEGKAKDTGRNQRTQVNTEELAERMRVEGELKEQREGDSLMWECLFEV